MNENTDKSPDADPASDPHGNTLTPLPGEPGTPDVSEQPRVSMSMTGLTIIASLVLSLGAVAAISIERFFTGNKKSDDPTSKHVGDRPAAASIEPKRLDMSVAPLGDPASAVGSATRIPALVPTEGEAAEPIAVRRAGPGGPAASGPKAMPP